MEFSSRVRRSREKDEREFMNCRFRVECFNEIPDMFRRRRRRVRGRNKGVGS